jgi:hypothetical protein
MKALKGILGHVNWLELCPVEGSLYSNQLHISRNDGSRMTAFEGRLCTLEFVSN